MKKQSMTKIYIFTVITVGLVCLLASVLNFSPEIVNFELIILSAFTIALGSRITVQIPQFKSHIAVSDVFIFLALLLYGGPTAIILAAVEAFCSSWRFCKKKITVFFNTALMAFSTTVVVVLLNLLNLNPVEIFKENDYAKLVMVVSVMALAQFITNSGFASIYSAFKNEEPIFETWKTYYLWTSITYFIGAIGAGILAKLVSIIGFGVMFATAPLIVSIYFTYRMYLQNVEISLLQATQAKEHAEVLEAKSEALRESEERYRSAFERFQSAFSYAPIGIALVGVNGKWLKVNHALCQILGFAEDEFLATDFHSMTHQDDLGETLVRIHELISGKVPTCQHEIRFIDNQENPVWTLWSASKVSESDSENLTFIFQIQDITDRKLAEEKLQYEATHDPLTQLPNRSFFTSRLASALNQSKIDSTHKVSVLFIDLDRFKVINDSLGHHIGDELLLGIAHRLRECVRPADTVARLGGDEFTILVEGRHNDNEVVHIAERIKEKFSQPFNLSGHEVYSSSSIGILHSSSNHLTPADLMRDADIAMYQAKRAGRARHEIFDQNMQIAAKEVLEMENDLRRAIERNEIQPYYQPIFSITTGKIEGFEALARWIHPTQGIILPNRFIPLAEEIGLIDVLGGEILVQAAKQGKIWNDYSKDFENLTMSVNLSCRQFSQKDLVSKINGILDTTKISPQNLKLEITETVVMEHKEKVLDMLNQFRELGVEIHIDDFGTGYSNLNYLIQLPISTLKIDHSFIHPMKTNDKSVEIIDVIIKLAHSLGMTVVAEGVETEFQLDKLKTLNCEAVQGNYFATPMQADEAFSFLKECSVSKFVPIPDLNQVSILNGIQ